MISSTRGAPPIRSASAQVCPLVSHISGVSITTGLSSPSDRARAMASIVS